MTCSRRNENCTDNLSVSEFSKFFFDKPEVRKNHFLCLSIDEMAIPPCGNSDNQCADHPLSDGFVKQTHGPIHGN